MTALVFRPADVDSIAHVAACCRHVLPRPSEGRVAQLPMPARRRVGVLSRSPASNFILLTFAAKNIRRLMVSDHVELFPTAFDRYT
jgi:hypothetical protein